MSDRTDYDLIGFAVSGLRALGRPDQADAIERLTKELSEARDGGEWRSKLAEALGKLMAAEAARDEARAAVQKTLDQYRDVRIMTLDPKALEIAAKLRYERHRAVNPDAPAWSKGDQAWRAERVELLRVDVQTYLDLAITVLTTEAP